MAVWVCVRDGLLREASKLPELREVFRRSSQGGLVCRPLLAAAVCLLIPCGCQLVQRPGKEPAPTLTLAAVGDLLLDRGVGKKVDRFGVDYPFKQVADLLSSTDIAFGNLECPLSQADTMVNKLNCFQARPSTAQCLVKGGFDILSLANNHVMDCGRTGLVETMARLEKKGLRWCGAGRTRGEAEAATVIEAKGVRVAFVGFCEFLPEGSFLREDKPTIAFASEEAVRRSVESARGQADVVVASFHWGVEYESRPEDRQEELATLAVEAGADLVLGHHPHVLQALAVVPRHSSPVTRHCLIAYSLGNFLFDQRRLQASDTVLLRCTLSKEGLVAAEALPVRIEALRPRPATRSEAERILSRLATLSRERGTTIAAGRITLADK